MKTTLSKTDIDVLKTRGISVESAEAQLALFRKGVEPVSLIRPCGLNDGIRRMDEAHSRQWVEAFEQTAPSKKLVKFVPASGAASRMFKVLFEARKMFAGKTLQEIRQTKDESGVKNALLEFIDNLTRFAFFEHLKAILGGGNDLDALLKGGQWEPILAALLEPDGLDYQSRPKGLIQFHRYRDHVRTAYEEHFAEANGYAKGLQNECRLHFTVSPEYEAQFKALFSDVRHRYESGTRKFSVEFSRQSLSTDTIAVDDRNEPFRDKNNELVFRPGGHGALIENLSYINADIVFIKNIDNVVPERLMEDTVFYKKLLGGFLSSMQAEAHGFLRQIDCGQMSEGELGRAMDFIETVFGAGIPSDIAAGLKERKLEFVFEFLNRPMRVCGMVLNEGEPGGGPFWVKDKEGRQSVQIIESSQVDLSDPEQKKIWESSTHFNPVDLVCGIKDFHGEMFQLPRFVDDDAVFISRKSKDGRELRALERPGLWNGAMAHWLTLFVEVPITTFNPVKTVFDLLRKEHQES